MCSCTAEHNKLEHTFLAEQQVARVFTSTYNTTLYNYTITIGLAYYIAGDTCMFSAKTTMATKQLF